MNRYVADRISKFKVRCKIEAWYCEQLYIHATTRLLAHKYAYYVLGGHYVDDLAYDLEEESWFVMGRSLGKLTENETSPCIGFDESHPLAKEAIEYANRLKLR